MTPSIRLVTLRDFASEFAVPVSTIARQLNEDREQGFKHVPTSVVWEIPKEPNPFFDDEEDAKPKEPNPFFDDDEEEEDDGCVFKSCLFGDSYYVHLDLESWFFSRKSRGKVSLKSKRR